MMVCLVGRESEVVGGGASEGPGGPHTMPRRGLGVARTTTWCGGMVGPPGLLQVPLCPILNIKI